MVLGLVLFTAVKRTAEKKPDVVWPAADIKWEAGPAAGTHVAKLWGDWMKDENYGVLVKFDGGHMNELHSHSHELKIVVLSGTFIHQPAGGAEMRVGPGSYVVQRAGANHVSGCAPGAECEFFMTSTGKFDLIPAKK
jgi:quercetin dioxygenase-like cupin family protein